MSDFFRFPHTPHLVWLGEGSPRDDKVLTSTEAKALLAGDLVVEEKLDGANLGFSLASNGRLRAQNRGQYLSEPYSGQFTRLQTWLAQHGDAMRAVITPDLLMFGEWCAARHSLKYTSLPDWFFLFDVYDRAKGRFWSTPRRNELADSAGLVTVPELSRGRTTLAALKKQVMQQSSRYRAEDALEGIVLRRESTNWCDARAKLVRPDFIQAIGGHWRTRILEWNRMTPSAR